jgi:hypothetical protein
MCCREAEQLGEDQYAKTLHFWSVGKLLRVLQAAKAAAKPLETLSQYGIIRHSVGSADQRRATSQPMKDTPQAPTADAATYTSSHVWLTGFLHFGEELGDCDSLYLCDSSNKLLSLMLDPSPRLVDQLVLVKRWVLVDKAVGGVRTAGAMFLEVHEEKPLSLLPTDDPYVDWTQEQVLEALEMNCHTKDPPMYTGSEPWAALVARLRGNEDNGDTTRVNDGAETPRKSRKRKRVHAVFGCVTSVSQISRQKDLASSHFFVEVESCSSCSDSATQSVTNVMFTGVRNMRWRLFLRPGKLVFVTDLVKVHSRECDMFLLQATYRDQSGDTITAGKQALETSVMVWGGQTSTQMCISQWIDASLVTYSKSFISRCCGKLIDYEAQVSRVLWDECIELQGLDGPRVVVCLFHFPYEQELVRLRKGCTVRLSGAHVLRWPTPAGGKLVLGLCPRSYFAVISYSDPSCPCLVMGTLSRRGRAHKKWSCLGDFHRQSMALSMCLLEALEMLDAKFYIGEDEQVRFKPSLLSFPRTRRRQAAAHVAAKLNLLRGRDPIHAALTLGALYLKCHAADADNCTTVRLPLREKLLTCNRVVTIRELQKLGEKKRSIEEAHGNDAVLSVKMLAADVDWCTLVGCIRGNVDSGDLEIVDRTGSISLHLNGAGADCFPQGERGVYFIRSFDVSVEDFNRVQGLTQDERVPLVYCLSCSAANAEFISMHDNESATYSQEEKAVTETAEAQELLLMVTHVDALPRSEIRSAGLLPEYRVVHGIVCPVGQELRAESFTKAAYAVEVLISTQCFCWHVRKGGFYRLKAAIDNKDTAARSSSSHHGLEDRAVGSAISYLQTMKYAEDNNELCLDSLNHFNGTGDGEEDGKRVFKIYRVEDGKSLIVPVTLECGSCANVRCKTHALCQQSDRDGSGLLVAPTKENSPPGNFNAGHVVKQTPMVVSSSEFVAMSVIRHFAQKFEEASPVCSLLRHSLIEQTQARVDGGANDEEPVVVMKVDPDLHKPHFVSVVGLITKKKYYWQSTSQPQFGQPIAVGAKRSRDAASNETSNDVGPTRQLSCIIQVRDLKHLDTVDIRVDASRFGILGALLLNSVVEFSRLKGFITRSGYKVFLSWSHFTAARQVCARECVALPLDAELYGSMPTTFLNELYRATCIDRMLHRYVAGVVHISYVLLKRKCGLCNQALQFNRRQGSWKHADPTESKYSRECAWRWQHLAPSDPAFKTRTYLGTTARCVIDDGSGQAELFLENGVAWELLTCPDGQRRRFDDILSNYVDELSYFSGYATNGSFATSRTEREQEYYQNELRAFVLRAIPSLRSVVVFARRFYKAKDKEGTSVLSFGKDIHLTTKTVPQPKLEATRIDRLHVRSELQRRLALLRLRIKAETELSAPAVDC